MPLSENVLILVIVAVVGVTFVSGFLALRGVWERRRQTVQRRLTGPDESDTILVDQLEKSLPGGSIKSWKGPQTMAGRLDQNFMSMVERTGLGLSTEQALGIICLVGVVLAGVLYLWRGELWLVIAGLIFGIVMPLVVFMILQARWRRQLQAQLPDCFFLMARSLRAGLSFDQALALAATEGMPPLSSELKRASEKINLGLSIPAALQMAARRIGLIDFNVFVSVVSLHRTTGGNLPLLMDRLATSTRDRNQYVGYFRSATALGRITAIAIGSAVPIIFIGYAIFEPTYFSRFFETVEGITALAIAFVLEIIGTIWLFYLLRVEY